MEEPITSATAQLVIRKPVAEVFEAFIEPTITRNFWFTKGSGRLEVGKAVVWEWEMYQVTTTVLAKEIVPNQKISIGWGTPPTSVDFLFQSLPEEGTFVTIHHYNFAQTGHALLAALLDSTSGFTTVLDGLKAFLEHQIHLNLIRDKFPHGYLQPGS
jgi:uncharacterized protein YndB with AHSA1/START domain